MTEKHKLEPGNNKKPTTGQKTRDLDELPSKPAIQSCNTVWQIPCADSCQLTTKWMSIIKLNTGYRLPY